MYSRVALGAADARQHSEVHRPPIVVTVGIGPVDNDTAGAPDKGQSEGRTRSWSSAARTEADEAKEQHVRGPLHSDLKRPDMWPILITGKPLNLYQWFWYQSNPYRQDIL